MNIRVVLSGLAVGAGFGFVLQRGRFCLNTAFRNFFYIKDHTLFRAYLLALVVAVLGANLIEQFGFLHLASVRQEFTWLANILGGFIFGIGMVLAGGCAASTWYKTGEGLVGSWMAALGFMIGASAVKTGALAAAAAYLRSFIIAPGTGPTLYSVLGVGRWAVIAPMIVAGLVFIFTRQAQYVPAQSGYSWRTTGVLVGLIAVIGLAVSEFMAGSATGMTFPGPSEGVFASIVSGGRLDWGGAMVVGVALGSFVSARSLHEFSWRSPRADVMVHQLGGGLLMGAGGMLAGGCAIGHGITGASTLALASLVSMGGIILGCWSMVYLMFVRSSSGE